MILIVIGADVSDDGDFHTAAITSLLVDEVNERTQLYCEGHIFE